MNSEAPTAAHVIDFAGLSISFDARVLRPRSWTAAQSRWASELLDAAPPGPVLELCAGVGHIGLLAVQGHDRLLTMVDLNPVACEFAEINARANHIAVDIREGALDATLAPDESFALVIADPPWVPSEQTARFPEDPLIAIDGGPAGLDIVWMCLDVIADHLAPGGSALLQLGTPAQVELVSARLTESHGDALRLVESRTFGERGVIARIDRLNA